MIILTCLHLLLLYFSVIWNSQTKAIYCRFRNFDWLTKITHILDGDVDLKRPKRLRDISFLVLSLWNWNLAQYLWFIVLKKLHNHSIIMNSKWLYMTIVAYGYYIPVFWFPLRRKNLNHYPTEFTAKNRELFLISELRKIENSFSLFRQQAANLQISTIWANTLHWHIQNKFCLWKNGIAREYYISLEKHNYNDIGTPSDFRQENHFRITTFLLR